MLLSMSIQECQNEQFVCKKKKKRTKNRFFSINIQIVKPNNFSLESEYTRVFKVVCGNLICTTLRLIVAIKFKNKRINVYDPYMLCVSLIKINFLLRINTIF